MKRRMLGILFDAAIAMLVVRALCACGAAPRDAEPPPAPTEWCFRALVSTDGTTEVIRGCFESSWRCEFWRGLATSSLAGHRGVKEAGPCR